MKTETTINALICPGCNAIFKHASSLSTHKNGNVKKGLKPCMAYQKAVGKEYEEKVQTRTLTLKDYDHLNAMWTRIKAWIDADDEKAKAEDVSVFEYVGFDSTREYNMKEFLKDFPPQHVDRQWIRERFIFLMNRPEKFVPALFTACYTNTTEGREHCVIRIPKVTHDSDLEVYDGEYWRPMKIHDMLMVFINKTHKYLSQIQVSEPDDVDLNNAWIKFDKWVPNESDEIMKRSKEDFDEDGRKRTYSYTTFVDNIKKILLGQSRDAINQLKKEHQRFHGK